MKEVTVPPLKRPYGCDNYRKDEDKSFHKPTGSKARDGYMVAHPNFLSVETCSYLSFRKLSVVRNGTN